MASFTPPPTQVHTDTGVYDAEPMTSPYDGEITGLNDCTFNLPFFFPGPLTGAAAEAFADLQRANEGSGEAARRFVAGLLAPDALSAVNPTPYLAALAERTDVLAPAPQAVLDVFFPNHQIKSCCEPLAAAYDETLTAVKVKEAARKASAAAEARLRAQGPVPLTETESWKVAAAAMPGSDAPLGVRLETYVARMAGVERDYAEDAAVRRAGGDRVLAGIWLRFRFWLTRKVWG